MGWSLQIDVEWAANWPGQALSGIGTASVPVLLDAMGDADRRYRQSVMYDWCRETLARIGDEAIPALQAACSDTDPCRRSAAADALAKIQDGR